MTTINTLDLKSFVANSISKVFDTMLSLEIEAIDTDCRENSDSNRIIGSVSFAGEVTGSVNIQVKDAFAHILTAAMLGMDVEEIDGDEEVYDVIGEMSNMLGGDLKSRLCDAGLPCELSIPSVMSGSNLKIESFKWSRHERFAFQHQQHTILVEVYIKTDS